MYDDFTQQTSQPTEEKICFTVASLVLGIAGLLAWCVPSLYY